MKLDIITSTYNSNPAFLNELYASLKAQTGSVDWRWVVRDDGSTTEWIDTSGDDRVVYSKGPNIGRGGSMAELMSRPDLSDWVVFVDADDWVEPTALECMVGAIEKNPTSVLVYSNHWKHRMSGIIEDHILLPSIAEDLLFGCGVFHLVGVSRAAYQRTSGYGPEFRYSSDYDLFLKMQEVGSFYHLDKQLYHWREHSSQMTTTARDQQIFTAYKAVRAACPRRSLPYVPMLTWQFNSLN